MPSGALRGSGRKQVNMASEYFRTIIWLFVALGLLVNGVYAGLSPTRWLSSRWTARRGMGPETSSSSVRFLGLVFSVVGGFFFIIFLRRMTAGGAMKYIFLTAWWLGALVWLANGIFALLSPTRWLQSTWNAARIPGLDTRPGVVRLIGAVATVIGCIWLIQGVHLALQR